MEQRIQSKKKWLAVVVASMVLIAYLLATTLLMWLVEADVIPLHDDSRGSFFISFTTLLFLFPRVYFDSFLDLRFTALEDALSPITWFWILGSTTSFILAILIISSAITVLKTPRIKFLSFPWFRSMLVVYLIALLFFGTPGKPKVEWYASVSDVSERIEAGQLGPFYSLTKYLNAQEGLLFFYDIIYAGDKFLLRQNTGDGFVLYDIQSLNRFQIERKAHHFPKAGWGLGFPDTWAPLPLPEGVSCNNVSNSNVYTCKALWYNEKLIFTQREPDILSAIAVSNDKRWMLLVLSQGYDPAAVYLVDLKGEG